MVFKFIFKIFLNFSASAADSADVAMDFSTQSSASRTTVGADLSGNR